MLSRRMWFSTLFASPLAVALGGDKTLGRVLHERGVFSNRPSQFAQIQCDEHGGFLVPPPFVDELMSAIKAQ